MEVNNKAFAKCRIKQLNHLSALIFQCLDLLVFENLQIIRLIRTISCIFILVSDKSFNFRCYLLIYNKIKEIDKIGAYF